MPSESRHTAIGFHSLAQATDVRSATGPFPTELVGREEPSAIVNIGRKRPIVKAALRLCRISHFRIFDSEGRGPTFRGHTTPAKGAGFDWQGSSPTRILDGRL
jgi:hypothetical protein